MIGYIKGKITALMEDSCFIEAGGIGYRVFISDKTRNQLTRGEETRLLTYMAVREDAILLYGFLTEEEYELFLLLISVSKIGPKMGMGILSSIDPAAFVSAVRNKKMTALTKLPGVGKKTAERIVLELKDKLGSFTAEEETEEDVPGPNLDEGVFGEAARALMALGYEMSEIEPVLKKMSGTTGTVSQIVGAALREFGKNS
jgi:holliday junction DNA helicase RuvA